MASLTPTPCEDRVKHQPFFFHGVFAANLVLQLSPALRRVIQAYWCRIPVLPALPPNRITRADAGSCSHKLKGNDGVVGAACGFNRVFENHLATSLCCNFCRQIAPHIANGIEFVEHIGNDSANVPTESWPSLMAVPIWPMATPIIRMVSRI